MNSIRRMVIAIGALTLSSMAAVNIAFANEGNRIKTAKNVIIMVSDGAGYNTHLSTEYWHGKKQPYDNRRFHKYPVATYTLRYGSSNLDDDSQDPNLVYDPVKAWDDTPVVGDADADGYPDYFAGYQWLQSTDPDSAGTMSAIVTGRKVYRGGINIDGYGNPLLTVPEVAKASGKSTGSISTVRYNHATPAAGGGAHNISRNNYMDISYEMFGAGVLDVMGGPGHPCFNANGSLLMRLGSFWPVGSSTGLSATGDQYDSSAGCRDMVRIVETRRKYAQVGSAAAFLPSSVSPIRTHAPLRACSRGLALVTIL